MTRGESAADSGPVVFSVVDDHPDLCYGVLGRLPQENLSFAAGVMAATVGEFLALDAAETRRSDVVLLDLRLRDGSGSQVDVGRGDRARVIDPGELDGLVRQSVLAQPGLHYGRQRDRRVVRRAGRVDELARDRARQARRARRACRTARDGNGLTPRKT